MRFECSSGPTQSAKRAVRIVFCVGDLCVLFSNRVLNWHAGFHDFIRHYRKHRYYTLVLSMVFRVFLQIVCLAIQILYMYIIIHKANGRDGGWVTSGIDYYIYTALTKFDKSYNRVDALRRAASCAAYTDGFWGPGFISVMNGCGDSGDGVRNVFRREKKPLEKGLVGPRGILL